MQNVITERMNRLKEKGTQRQSRIIHVDISNALDIKQPCLRFHGLTAVRRGSPDAVVSLH